MAKVLGNGDEDVAVEGTQLHHCCSQAKLKCFLGMFLVKGGVDADRNLCDSEEHLGLVVANLFIQQQWGLID